tara:strand:+ start:35111 stop:36118 length:1008 start_codon:yes stop_codon:yes gene_type:complete
MLKKTLKTIKKYFTESLAIDLGTSQITIATNDKILLKEPTVVILRGTEVIAVGEKAKNIISKIPKDHRVVYPIVDGEVYDFDVAEVMITYFIEKVMSNHPNKLMKPSPKVISTLATKSSPVQQKNIKELFFKAGASEVILIPQSLSAAIGLDLPIEEEECYFILNIGAGLTELCVISLNSILEYKTINIGGNSLTKEIKELILARESINISYATAEKLKIKLSNPLYKSYDDEKTLAVIGQEKNHNKPVELIVGEKLISKAVKNQFNEIFKNFLKLLKEINPDIAEDLYKNGLYITGGTSNIKGLPEYIESAIGLKVYVPENNEFAALEGCKVFL